MSEPNNYDYGNQQPQAPQPQYGGDQQYGGAPQGYGAPQQPPAGAPPKKSKKGWFIGCGIALVVGLIILVVAIILIVRAVGDAGDSSTSSASASSSSSASSSDSSTSAPSSSSDTPSSSESSSSSASAAKPADGKPVAVNKAASVGKFEVKILSTSTAKTVGKDFREKKAAGEFLVVEVQAKNNGDKANYFSDRDVNVITKDGDQLDVAKGTSFVFDDSMSIEKVNPGSRVTGKMVYDIPKGQQAEKIQISDPDFQSDDIVDFAIK